MKNVILAALFLGLLLAACGTPDPMTASIAGSVYFDENSDEDCDCECGIPDIHVKLFLEACGGELVEILHTDEEGNFIFTALGAGQYCVFSDLDPQCNGYMPTTSISYSVDLASGEEITLDGFGYNLFVDEVQK